MMFGWNYAVLISLIWSKLIWVNLHLKMIKSSVWFGLMEKKNADNLTRLKMKIFCKFRIMKVWFYISTWYHIGVVWREGRGVSYTCIPPHPARQYLLYVLIDKKLFFSLNYIRHPHPIVLTVAGGALIASTSLIF